MKNSTKNAKPTKKSPVQNNVIDFPNTLPPLVRKVLNNSPGFQAFKVDGGYRFEDEGGVTAAYLLMTRAG